MKLNDVIYLCLFVLILVAKSPDLALFSLLRHDGRRCHWAEFKLVAVSVLTLDVSRFGIGFPATLPSAARRVVVGRNAAECCPGVSGTAELRWVHSSGRDGTESGSEVGGEECVEDWVETGVAVGETVGDDLEDDEAAELDVVDAKALEEQNNLEIKLCKF